MPASCCRLLLCWVEQRLHDEVAPLPHLVEAMCLSLAAAISAEWPSGKAPTTRVLRLISRMILSSGLLTGMITAGAFASPPKLAYGATIRDRGTGEHDSGQADHER